MRMTVPTLMHEPLTLIHPWSCFLNVLELHAHAWLKLEAFVAKAFICSRAPRLAPLARCAHSLLRPRVR